MEDLIFECKGISKAFGGTQALDSVELKVGKGEVHALLGENGAGKSTLMKCVIGLHKPDSGEMFFEGRPYTAHGPAEAIEAGISMIHQELNPEPHLTIAESIFLGREDTHKGTPILNKKQTEQRAQTILNKFDFNKKASSLMEELTLAEVQMIEIIRAVSCNARLIIMDEPTSSLDSEETNHLFRTIRDLKSKGASIIYISHRMEEIFEICDKVSIFRDGKYIDTCLIKDVGKDELISKMVGREVKNVFPKVDCPAGNVALRVEGLSGKGFSDVSFEVRAGEILGFSGLVGSGRSETVRGIFGLDPIFAGKIYIKGVETVIKNPADAIRKGICMVNEDRKLFGLCLQRSLRENISLPNLPARHPGIVINQKKETQETQDVAKTLTVKAASIESEAYSLSGGNQQKVVIAKWIMAEPRILILDEPTRGVDVGAKAEIHSLMCRFAAEGLAVIMISSELPEVMGMSDRILVFHEGKTMGIVKREDILSGKETQETILAREFGQYGKGKQE
ncbi:MAG: sugar ABC transporter ATP-binding protein [Spirochaetaceae bacterium]|jgi:ribose transport system ATP-binding protein/inositol transport system ATP-binding protein|nr:sugar ABC transporter ATP-binding protein [Spirochaetaceae bacterium]